MRPAVPRRRRPAAQPDPLDEAVARLVSGDEDAFRIAFRTMQPGLLRYLTHLVGPNDAEDVAAETWAQACRDLARFRGAGDEFRAWVTTIARHRGLDHLRARRRRPVADQPADELIGLAGLADTADEAAESVGTRQALALIGRLPAEQAEIVLLRVLVGLDAPAVARIVGKRPGAVRMATQRALQVLATHLASGSDTFASDDAGESR